MDERMNSNDRIFYFLIGGAIGALTALFLAPKSGKEARYFLADKAQEGKRVIREKLMRSEEELAEERESILTNARHYLKEARNIPQREKEIILAAINEGRRVYHKEKARMASTQTG